jgi:hypothetical protein
MRWPARSNGASRSCSPHSEAEPGGRSRAPPLLRRLILLGAVLPALLILLALIAAGCGGDREFEAREFVDEANAKGADLVLGDSLASITEDVEVFAIGFAENHDEPDPGAGGGHEHGGGGSMIVAGDSESASEEFARCESAVTLVCYRAANVVLYFDVEPSDEHVAKVDAAIRALGDG